MVYLTNDMIYIF